MENSGIKNKYPYKKYINDENEKEDFEKEIINNKLSLRKKKLFQILLQKRQKYNISILNKVDNGSNQLSQVSILIQREDLNDIQSGLNIFYEYLINNSKLEKENIKYILENIYYRLLDIISSDKSFENNKSMNKIFLIINYLTTENNVFIEPLTENFFLIQLKKIIDININNNIFISIIIPLLSDMLTISKKFVQIMNEIDIIKIMKIQITQNNNDKENIENLMLLMNNFIMNISQDKTHKFKFILDYILNFLNRDEIRNNLNKFINEESLIIISILDILIYMSNNQENLNIIKNDICFKFIKALFLNYNNINNNLYIIKCYELLSNILLNTKNFSEKNDIIKYFYQNNNNISNGLPFLNELIESIKNKKRDFIYILLNCIISLLNNYNELCELYCSNNNFISILLNLFIDKTSKKIKNEIIIFFINLIENNNIKIYKYILNTDIISIFISYLRKKINSKNESRKIIIYNILYFFNKCLLIDNENNINNILKILDKNQFKEIIETLIENKDDSISDISRNIFIKYYSGPENLYIHNKNGKIDMEID